MGQKFSELRGIFGAMEEKSVSEVRISVSTVGYCRDESVESGATTSNAIRNDDNGNSESATVNEHFEDIYCSGGSGKGKEENGNDLDQSHHALVFGQSSQGTSGERSEDGGGPAGESKRSKSGLQKRTDKGNGKDLSRNSKKKRPHWVLRFNCARLKNSNNNTGGSSEPEIAEPNLGIESCVCTGYRRTEEHHLGAGVVFEATTSQRLQDSGSDSDLEETHFIDLTRRLVDLRNEEFPVEDCDERARMERAREIAEGVDPPPGFRPSQHIQLVCPQDVNIDSLTAFLHSAALSALSQLEPGRGVHTQVDYIHCLVPDLLQITSCSFYWGKMDRYEAERLLDGKPEGTFLLRDSAQEEYLFSVSFRKYGRSLHARVEQWKHMFSFDSHDPGVFSSPTVCGLIEHYKDPSCCMFFEPMLTIPLHRNFAFPLQHLSRAVICSRISYDGISQLKLPKALKGYLKEYHYKQRVKVRRFDSEQ